MSDESRSPAGDGAQPGVEGDAPVSRTGGRVRMMVGLLAVAVIVIVAVGWAMHRPKAAAPGNPHHLPAMPAGRVAPQFAVPRLGGGAPVALTAFAGRPVVVNFFASWCPNCVDEMKTFAAASVAARDRVAFVGVDSNDSDQRGAQNMLRDAGVRYPVGVDSDARVAVGYWVVGLPTTVFIDQRGKVVGEAFGSESAGALKAWIKRLTAS